MSVGIVDKQTGDRIPTAGMPAIDNALSATSTNPVQNAIITAALANKQDKTDNNLQTTDKTVVGAVNELKSGLTNLVKVQHTAPYFDNGGAYVQMPGYVLVAAFETAASWNGITILNVQGGAGAVITNSNFSGEVEVTLIWLKI